MGLSSRVAPTVHFSSLQSIGVVDDRPVRTENQAFLSGSSPGPI